MFRLGDLAPKSLKTAAVAALALSFWRCGVVEPPPDRAYFHVSVPDSLSNYDSLVIVLRDADGVFIDTLFSGKLDSAGELTRLPAPHFQGGMVRVEIQGFVDDSAVFAEARLFDPATSSVQLVQFQPSGSGTPSGSSSGGTAPGFALSWMDTTVSIHDSLRISLMAVVASAPTPLRLRWDANGDGRWDDSLQPKSDLRAWPFGFRMRQVGEFSVAVQIALPGGAVGDFRVKVKVLLDPPVADAGPDTSVPLGGTILLHARGQDRFGPIVRREWSQNGGAFWPVPWQDTRHPAPENSGIHTFVLRVTDSDSLSAFDTLRVTVTNP